MAHQLRKAHEHALMTGTLSRHRGISALAGLSCVFAAPSEYKSSCLASAALRFKLEGLKDYLGLCERFGLLGKDFARCSRFENKPA